MTLGIRSKLFLSSLALIGLSVVAAELYLAHALEAQLTDRIRGDLLVRGRLIAQRIASTDAKLNDTAESDRLADELGVASGVRVTLIRPNGVVAGDSEVDSQRLADVENHANRPEIVDANSRGEGSSVRRSDTVGKRMMYAAVPITSGGTTLGTARVAMPLTQIDDALAQMRRTLLAAALFALGTAGIVSYSAAELTSRKLRELTHAARQMAAGNLAVRTRTAGHDEIVELGGALNHLAGSLSASLSDLRGERDLLTSILSSMNEGVLVVGADDRVVLTNPALREMLLIPPDAVGKPVLHVIRNAELNEVLQKAARGETSEVETDLAGLVH